MKFNLLNNDQIQIIITKTDLSNKNMRTLFQDILEKANQEYGFEVMRDTNLMVEAYPLTDEGMILTITKIDDLELELAKYTAEALFNEPWAVFMFETLDDIIELSKIVADDFNGDSMMFKFEDKYLLYLEDVNDVPEKSRGYFTEFGSSTSMTLPFLLEHAECMVQKKAINCLCQL